MRQGIVLRNLLGSVQAVARYLDGDVSSYLENLPRTPLEYLLNVLGLSVPFLTSWAGAVKLEGGTALLLTCVVDGLQR